MLYEEARQQVVDRLDRDHIENLAERAKVWLAQGQTVELEYTPGNMTWYSLIVGPVARTITTGKEPRSFLASGQTPFFCAYAQRGTLTWFSPDRTDWEWIAAKLTDNEHDQVAIGLLLEAVF